MTDDSDDADDGYYGCSTVFCGLCLFPFGHIGQRRCATVTISPPPESSPSELQFPSKCYPGCRHRHGLRTAFHQECYSLWKPIISLATRGSFFYPPGYSASHRITPTITQCLRQVYDLPEEICYCIGRHLTGIYNAAAVTAMHEYEVKRIQVDISRDIWACFIKFHHGFYISNLSNEPSVEEEGRRDRIWVLVRKHVEKQTEQRSNESSDTLYLAYDSWGLRRIIFDNRNRGSSVAESADVWWAALSKSPGKRTLDCYTDGVKLRNVLYSGDSVLMSRVHWPLPLPPQSWPELRKLQETNYHSRMSRVVFNDPQTRYYIAGTLGDTVAFQHLEGYLSWRRSRVTWLYAPLSPGEWIRHVWLRSRQPRDINNKSEYSFILVTNTGRTLLMGEVPPPGHEPGFTYSLIASLSNTPTSLYMDLVYGLRAISVGLGATGTTTAAPALPVPESPYPSGTDDYLYSIAQLESVREIQFCQLPEWITGIVLHYGDDNSASLGSVNLNHLSKRRQVKDAFWVRVVPAHRLPFPRVADILLEPPLKNQHEYLRVSLHGSLEWWYSFRQCQLYHDGSKTINPSF